MKNNGQNGERFALGIALLAAALVSVAIGFWGGIRLGKSIYLAIGSIAAAILAFPGLWFLTGQGISQESMERLKQQLGEEFPIGYTKREPVRAEVLGVSRNLRSQGESETYYIICRYTDPITGKTEDFTSRELPAYPGKEVIGKTVTVYFDRNGYRVDIEPILPLYLKK